MPTVFLLALSLLAAVTLRPAPLLAAPCEIGVPDCCENDADCTDNDACNGDETCQAGTCTAGTPLVCDDGEPCTTDSCEPATGCTTTPAPDGTTCNDGNACTQTDTCQAGVCTGSNPPVCDDNNPCTTDSCDPARGCTATPVANGTSCSDGNACNGTETCQGGACTAGTPLVCNDGDPCTTDACEPATGCTTTPAPDGTTCNDGNACTQTDTCQAGVCTGSNPPVCDDNNPCTTDSCDPARGCTATPVANGTSCSDGNACNGAETCQAGTCTAGSPPVCDDNNPCTADSCDPATGCRSETIAGCTRCTASSECNDSNPCTDDSCNAGRCINTERADGASCSDGNLCNGDETCQAGTCTAGTPVVCTAKDQCHDAGVCNPATGLCSDPPKSNGTTCNDGNACTQTDTCQAGVCTGSNPPVCDDNNPCTTDSCDPARGCTATPVANGTSCSDGNACNGAETCQAGTCTAGSPPVCDDNNPCTADSCDPATGCRSETIAGCTRCTASSECNDSNPCTDDSCNAGRCINTERADGASCSDGNLCNGDETCQAGTCTAGTPVVCTAKDQCHDAGVCNPATGLCSDPPKSNGTTCNDGNACTQTDTCQAGVCTGTNPVVCTAKDQCHSAGTCDPATGVCSNPTRPDGTTCNDGNACTQTDTCQAGVCTGTNPVVCTAKDQCHRAGTCDPSTGLCSDPPKPNGTTCNDGNACTQTDTCQAGVCTGSDPVVCMAMDQCHSAGTCNPTTGLCSNPPKPNGTACNDGNACTQTDICQTGVCTGTNPVACTAQDQCHSAGTCNPSTGLCSNPAKPDDTPCNDGNACTQTDTCQAGVCTGSNPPVCDDDNPCTTDSCNPPTGCRHQLVAGCTLCTASSQCNDGNPCTNDVCDAGRCLNTNRADGTACNDGDACTVNDTCRQGVCTGGSARVCNDQNACTTDACDTLTGCQFDPIPDCTPCTRASQCNDDNPCTSDTCESGRCVNANRADGTACNDGNACTQTDTCQAGACTGTNPIVCTAKDQCHDAGTCDPATGVCSNPTRPDGTACNDGNACTQTDACRAGVCTGGNPVVCTATDQCHLAGTCDPATGVCSNPPKPDGTSCDDGSLCTRRDECRQGVCTGTNPVRCPGVDPCEPGGSCDPATGRCSTSAQPDGTPCDDRNPCTRIDVCEAGACRGGDPVVCTPKDQCHDAGTCDPATGVCSNPPKPDGTTCNDGNACTRTDACVAGVCTGTTPVVCTAKDQCHLAGTCDPATGICSDPPQLDGTSCDDGNRCTRRDRCQAGACIGEDPLVCSSDNDCEVPGVCDPGTGRCPAPQPRPDGTLCQDDGASCTEDRCEAGRCVHVRVDARCLPADPCSTAVCFPEFPTANAAGCVAGAPAPDGGECTEDADPCTDDRCQGGICRHDNVPERRLCDPVGPAWRRAVQLLGETAAFSTSAAASASNGTLPRDRWPALSERLAALTGDLEVVERTLAGRIPVPEGKDTIAGRRARAVLPIVSKRLLPGWRAVVKLLKSPDPAGKREASAGDATRNRARALLAGTKALKRDLARLRRISRIFAR